MSCRGEFTAVLGFDNSNLWQASERTTISPLVSHQGGRSSKPSACSKAHSQGNYTLVPRPGPKYVGILFVHIKCIHILLYQWGRLKSQSSTNLQTQGSSCLLLKSRVSMGPPRIEYAIELACLSACGTKDCRFESIPGGWLRSELWVILPLPCFILDTL